MGKVFALGRQAPVAADTGTATSVGVCLDQDTVPLEAYWLTWEDELLKDAGPALPSFTLRISTKDMVITLPLPTEGISVGKVETCDVRVRVDALAPRLLKVVPEGLFARVHLVRGFDVCSVWLHGQPVFDGDRLWRGDAMDIEGMRIELL